MQWMFNKNYAIISLDSSSTMEAASILKYIFNNHSETICEGTTVSSAKIINNKHYKSIAILHEVWIEFSPAHTHIHIDIDIYI